MIISAVHIPASKISPTNSQLLSVKVSNMSRVIK